MAPIRFILLGGFLGAGKTTTIARLAQLYQEQGLRVGIVTNDQAADLVDTQSLRSQGFDVGEVAGACFCCHFNELTSVVGKLGLGQQPDVILAEPVGSCTDLVATVIQPLRQLFGSQFSVAPYGVLVKTSHGQKILGGQSHGGFSSKAAYIFRKQLEEADFLVVNRIDELPPAEVDAFAALIHEQYPELPVLRLSAKTGAGCQALVEMLAQTGEFGRRILDIDYDIYAEGEAELGWLNATAAITASSSWDLDQLLLALVTQLQSQFRQQGAEPAHLKAIGLADGAYGVANVVSSGSPPELSLPSQAQVREAQLVVNARVGLDPAILEAEVRQAVLALATAYGAEAKVIGARSLRPGRPEPTHRLAKAI